MREILATVHFFCDFSLHASLVLGDFVDGEEFFRNNKQVFNLFAIDKILTTRIDGVVD